MSNAMNQAMATSTLTDAVQDLLPQIAEENNLDIRAQLNAVPAAQHTVRTQEQEEVAAQSSHLAALHHAS
jgi:hypothetical protein